MGFSVGDRVRFSGEALRSARDYWLSRGEYRAKEAAKRELDRQESMRGTITGLLKHGYTVQWDDGTTSQTISYRLQKNPPFTPAGVRALVRFNPQARVVGAIPGSATEIRYRRATDGRRYRHPFTQRGVRQLALADGSVLLRGRTRLWGDEREPGFDRYRRNPGRTMKAFDVYWSPTGQKIATVRATTARAAKRKAPAPYRKYLGELYVLEAGADPTRSNPHRRHRRNPGRKSDSSALTYVVLGGVAYFVVLPMLRQRGFFGPALPPRPATTPTGSILTGLAQAVPAVARLFETLFPPRTPAPITGTTPTGGTPGSYGDPYYVTPGGGWDTPIAYDPAATGWGGQVVAPSPMEESGFAYDPAAPLPDGFYT